MNTEFWEIDALTLEDCYKSILLQGCVVQKGDVEMCDLRFFYHKYENEHSPKIQIYKKNVNGQEYIQMFHNFTEAAAQFVELTKGI